MSPGAAERAGGAPCRAPLPLAVTPDGRALLEPVARPGLAGDARRAPGALPAPSSERAAWSRAAILLHRLFLLRVYGQNCEDSRVPQASYPVLHLTLLQTFVTANEPLLLCDYCRWLLGFTEFSARHWFCVRIPARLPGSMGSACPPMVPLAVALHPLRLVLGDPESLEECWSCGL